jgi:hypothetical protein
MDRQMHRLINILLLAGLLILPVSGQTVPADLVKAIREGNAKKMSAYFHQSLELTILEEDYVASKNQATRIMENFFKNHPPSGFTISFEGTKEKSRYAIGSLKTGAGAFRVNMFFLNSEGDPLIYYMSIEKESSYELHP